MRRYPPGRAVARRFCPLRRWERRRSHRSSGRRERRHRTVSVYACRFCQCDASVTTETSVTAFVVPILGVMCSARGGDPGAGSWRRCRRCAPRRHRPVRWAPCWTTRRWCHPRQPDQGRRRGGGNPVCPIGAWGAWMLGKLIQPSEARDLSGNGLKIVLLSLPARGAADWLGGASAPACSTPDGVGAACCCRRPDRAP